MDGRLVVVVLCLNAAGCGSQTISPVSPSSLAVSPSTTIPTTSDVTPISGRLAFSSDRDGTYYIYTSSGTDVRRLAPGDRPKWSPNGTQIVYQAAPSGSGIYVMNADGSGQRYLADGGQPSWSPDGSQIVFVFADTSTVNIHVIGANGTGLAKIAAYADNDGTPQTPAWSPDGRTIAFILASYYDDPWLIYAVGFDGSSPRRLTNTPGIVSAQSEPEWSPDGSRIVFSSAGGIATVNADGTGWQSAGSGGLLYPDWIAGGFVVSKHTGPGPTTLDGAEHRIFAIEGTMQRQVVPDVSTGRKYMDIHPDWTR